MTRPAEHITDELRRLRDAMKIIATYRQQCHSHDDDSGHARRCFGAADVAHMEHIAQVALGMKP
jgi:hypothetical protein